MKWRWHWRDFGYRFSVGPRAADDFYEGLVDGDYYAVPRRHRKLSREALALHYKDTRPPAVYQTVACPWQNYERHWDEIVDIDGWPLNYAGCLDHDEVRRQEDLGVARALEYVADLQDDTPITFGLIRDIHRELMGDIYPFAGEWRTVPLAKGVGFWPFPPGGIAPMMEQLQRDVLSRTPFYSSDRNKLCRFVAEVMNEILAIHPFREGNGRLARIAGSLLFLQNDFPPLAEWDREQDESDYIDACEEGRVNLNHRPLARLLRRWLDAALERGGA